MKLRPSPPAVVMRLDGSVEDACDETSDLVSSSDFADSLFSSEV